MPVCLHRPPSEFNLPLLCSEIGRALRDLECVSSIPSHWEPMHGDLTPWNLRNLTDGSLYLFDWESAGWGPPGADEVLYRATDAAVRGAVVTSNCLEESIDFWTGRFEDSRARDRRELKLRDSVLSNLLKMRG
jgi:hypothetical protein